METKKPWYRPCYIITKSKEEKAIFHGWAQEEYPTDKGYIKHKLGLIEYRDGSVAFVKPRSIVFADDICDYVWISMEEKKDV